MIQLSGPYPLIVTTIQLPNPQWGDSESVMAEVQSKRAMDGTLYTYIRNKGRRKLLLSFRLTRLKGLELRAFLKSYMSERLKLVDHLDRVWLGYLSNNPFEFDTPERGTPGGGSELQNIELQFEGELQ